MHTWHYAVSATTLLPLLALTATTTYSDSKHYQREETSSATHINVQVNPPITVSPHFNQSNQQESQQKNSQTTTMTQKIAQTFSFKTLWTTLPEKVMPPARQAAHTTHTFFKNHKKKILASSIGSGYLMLCYQVLKGNHYLGNPSLWSSWKSSYALKTLYAMPREQLANELIVEIQKRHTTSNALGDFMLPLITFLSAIDQEIYMLRIYTHMYTWIDRLALLYILPINHKRFASARERLRRALFFKNLFLTWAAHYKIDHNKTIARELEGRPAKKSRSRCINRLQGIFF